MEHKQSLLLHIILSQKRKEMCVICKKKLVSSLSVGRRHCIGLLFMFLIIYDLILYWISNYITPFCNIVFIVTI